MMGSIPGRGGDFSHYCHIQTGSGVHPALYPLSTGAFLLGDKVAGA